MERQGRYSRSPAAPGTVVELRRVDLVLPRPDLRGATGSGGATGGQRVLKASTAMPWWPDLTLLGPDPVLLRWQRHAAPALETEAGVGFEDGGSLLQAWWLGC
jgi:hypothetical protein